MGQIEQIEQKQDTSATKAIEDIEEQLKATFISDKSTWITTYKLMHQVDADKLWQPQYRSYTQWVNHLATLCNVHVSVIWKRLKAGKTYSAYADRAREQGRRVPSLDDMDSMDSATGISPDNLELINKIAQSNAEVADRMIDQAMQGGLNRSDLRNAWAAVKSHKESKGQKAVRSNAYDSIDVGDNGDNGDNGYNGDSKSTESVGSMTAGDIVLALSRHTEWLDGVNGDAGDAGNDEEVGKVKSRPGSIYHKEIYHAFTEFPVHSGVTRHAQRIDVLVAETHTTQVNDNVALHGIEIKVDKHDLINDHKMLDYKPFVDYLYFAIPANLYEDCVSVADDNVGIIIIESDGESDENVPRISRRAVLNRQAYNKIEALSTALSKALLL